MGQGRAFIPQREQGKNAIRAPWTKYLRYFAADDPARIQILGVFRELEQAGIPLTDESAAIAVKLGQQRRAEAQEDRRKDKERWAATQRSKKLLEDHPDGVVYYVRRGDFIKIGTTRAFAKRMGSLRPDEILAVEPGSYSTESTRHATFDHCRVRMGDSMRRGEYFHPTDDLVAHITALRDAHGTPTQDLLAISDGRSFFAERRGETALDEVDNAL